MATKFNIIAVSNEEVRHLPCTATLTTDSPVGFETKGKNVKATLSWDNKISPNQNSALINVEVSACNNGKNLTFVCGKTEYITDQTN